MPELPEVQIVVNNLKNKILGHRILKLQVNRHDLRQKVPGEIADIAEGKTIINIERRAKYIVISLNGLNEDYFSLIIHLGMSGKLLLDSFSLNNENLNNIQQQKHDHVLLILADPSNGLKSLLKFNDPRRFGLFIYKHSSEIEAFFMKQGLDPIQQKFNGKILKQLIFKTFKKASNINIKAALMDGKLIAGIGNIIASESLFIAKILPNRKVISLSDQEFEELAEAIIQIIEKSIKYGGSSLKDYSDIYGNQGDFQNHFQVYKRQNLKCHRCVDKAAMIMKIVQAGRSSFYCKKCQK